MPTILPLFHTSSSLRMCKCVVGAVLFRDFACLMERRGAGRAGNTNGDLILVTPLYFSITPSKASQLAGTKITVSGRGFDPDRAIQSCKWTSNGGTEISVPVEAVDARSFICVVISHFFPKI